MDGAAKDPFLSIGPPTMLPASVKLPLASTSRPRLFVVIDTEEEFDWDAPYSPSNTGVSAMRHIGRVQTIFDRFNIVPTYMVDYPVVSQVDGFGPLLDFRRDGRCTVGAHLHPWVNPPYGEEISRRNSFTLNLPEALQRAKIGHLAAMIEERFGDPPRVFKAGRYGIGPATVAILHELGFQVDASVCPRMDFTSQEGPSFADFDAEPFFLTERLLEIPCTVEYVGWAGSLRPAVHRLASHEKLAGLRAVGLAARLHATNRIMLSPEGNTLDEMRLLMKALMRRGTRTFTLSFHSPSVEPGHTPYVRTKKDLDSFLHTIESFCELFLGELNGIPATPLEFRAALPSISGLTQ